MGRAAKFVVWLRVYRDNCEAMTCLVNVYHFSSFSFDIKKSLLKLK